MESLSLSRDDLIHHVVTFGIDIFPPVEIPDERTRLNMFYEEACNQRGELYEKLLASDTEFKISKPFSQRPGKRPAIHVDTFTLTQRGPVFVFPIVLPTPIGNTGLPDPPFEQFEAMRKLFFSALVNRQIMRVGMIRDLLFATGEGNSRDVLAAQASFSGADLVGGNCLLVFRDAKCNVRIKFEPVEVTKTTQLPVGTRVDERAGYGLRVQLDVNNAEVRPLDDADIEGILERAASLWPDELIEYVKGRRAL